jgi:hypothetical protein
MFAVLAMLLAAFVEIARVQYAPEPGNYYDVSARDNITPCQSIDDFNPYNYQDYLAGVGDVDKPLNCHQTCDNYYDLNGITYLNLTCIDCDNIPQMSNISVFWQVSASI